MSNCAKRYDDLRDAIANQPDSPHIFDLSPTADQVENNRQKLVKNSVDNFISGVLATDRSYPVFPHPVLSHWRSLCTRDGGIQLKAASLSCADCGIAGSNKSMLPSIKKALSVVIQGSGRGH